MLVHLPNYLEYFTVSRPIKLESIGASFQQFGTHPVDYQHPVDYLPYSNIINMANDYMASKNARNNLVVNRKSILLDDHENELIFNALNRKCFVCFTLLLILSNFLN